MTTTNSVQIRTPEGIEFALPLASVFSRMLAFAVDFCAILAAGTLLDRLVAPLRIVSIDTAQAFYIVFYFATSLFYGMLAEWFWRGQTLGKRLLGLRVMEASGLRLKPAQIIVRNLLRFIDLLPAFYLVGGASCVLTKRRQRLGDIAAGTIVIRTEERVAPDVDQLLGIKFNSFASSPHLAARLRQKSRPEVVQLALEAVIRRDELQPNARLTLFHEVAEYFRLCVPFPAESVEHLSDEQYVRNVVDILFKRSVPHKLPKGSS